MQVQEIQQRLIERFRPATITAADLEALDPWIEVASERLPEVCLFLRDEPDLRFDMLHCITGVDYFEPDAKKAAAVGLAAARRGALSPVEPGPPAPAGAEGLAAAVEGRRRGPAARGAHRQPRLEHGRLARARGVRPDRASASPAIPTCGGSSCPEDWVGHPLRKDYEMPLEYHGIRGR